jgi:2,4-dienoyl-CoA reductase-like NADH-dependent reductase (Old Yellow Enzyme family)
MSPIAAGPIFQPASIGPVALRNRLVRAATGEAMGRADGSATDQLVALYETLARNEVGLIITGHLFVERRGRYVAGQTGIDADSLVPGLRRLTDAVHRHGGKIFAELAHAGSQSRVPETTPLAPSPVPNELTGREVAGASPEEVELALEAFAQGARRAVQAGFDGVHVHGANGYLISEFMSPLTNRREDVWGDRDAFALELVRRVRAQVPADRAVTMKLGCFDAVEEPGGLTVEESVRRAGLLVAAGLDAIEVSCNVMRLPSDSAAQYVAVDRRRALEDLLLHRLHRGAGEEAYFLPLAQALRAEVDTKVMLVGGLRRRETMERVLRDPAVDFVNLSRPFIREPDLARQLAEGRTGRVDCTSCNLCLTHEGHHSLRCWRTPRHRLLQHAVYRFTGGFKRAPTIGTRGH